MTPRLTSKEGARVLAEYRKTHDTYSEEGDKQPPFELERGEGALRVATGITFNKTCLNINCNRSPLTLAQGYIGMMEKIALLQRIANLEGCHAY